MINRIWFPVVLLLGFLLLLIDGSMKLPARGMLFPLIVGGGGIILAAVLIITGIVKKEDKVSEEAKEKLMVLKRQIPVLLIMVGILPTIWFFGFIAGAALHAFIFLKYFGEKWSLSAGVAVSLAVIFYFGLYLGMKIPFNQGILFELLKG